MWMKILTMKTKSCVYFAVFTYLVFIAIGCKDDDDAPNISEQMTAAVNGECLTNINFTGDDIYGFSCIASDVGVKCWLFGGHPANANNEIPDLGLAVYTNQLTSGNYPITSVGTANAAFIFYIDKNNNQFTSTTNNTSIKLVNTPINDVDPTEFVSIGISFQNAELYNPGLDSTICVNNFNHVSVVDVNLSN